MSEWKARRFWTEARVRPAGAGWEVTLDDKPLRTPGKSPLILPTEALARAIAAEWDAQSDIIDPLGMPVTRAANSAIERVAPQRHAVAAMLADYAGTDLLSYRAEGQGGLAARQAEGWDPLLDWARGRYDVSFAIAEGVMPVDQPPATVARLSEALLALSPFRLAAVAPLVTIGGSLIVALAVEAGALSGDTGWDAVTLDEMWQERRWGEDADAKAARDARQQDWDAAVFVPQS